MYAFVSLKCVLFPEMWLSSVHALSSRSVVISGNLKFCNCSVSLELKLITFFVHVVHYLINHYRGRGTNVDWSPTMHFTEYSRKPILIGKSQTKKWWSKILRWGPVDSTIHIILKLTYCHHATLYFFLSLTNPLFYEIWF